VFRLDAVWFCREDAADLSVEPAEEPAGFDEDEISGFVAVWEEQAAITMTHKEKIGIFVLPATEYLLQNRNNLRICQI
jgi:hypothetical protein